MSSKVEYFLKKTLGEDFTESLIKVELWKPGTKSTIDHEEIRTALQIVPRAILSFLIYHLAPMNIGDNKKTQLPVQESGAILEVTKHERDVYSGHIEKDGKIIVDFKFRSIPGIGLVIMSAFELYDVNKLVDAPAHDVTQDKQDSIQQMIDDRLALHDLIGRVVDKKIMEKDAIHQLFLKKLSELRHIARTTAPMDNEYFRGMANGMEVAHATANDKEPEFVEAKKSEKKKRPLAEFLEKRKKKGEYSVVMAKGEKVDCPDCHKNIFDGAVFSGCVCFGDDMSKKVFIKKSEDGIKVRFSKGWDEENIEMLLEVLRKKHE